MALLFHFLFGSLACFRITNNHVVTRLLFVCLCIIYDSCLINTYNACSFYYNLVGFLNTKTNPLVILFLFVCFVQSRIKPKILRCGGIIPSLLPLCVVSFSETFVILHNTNYETYQQLNRLNLNLLNGIMLIHPPLLYVVYSMLIITAHIFLLGGKTIFQKNVSCYDLKTNLLVYFRGVYGIHVNNSISYAYTYCMLSLLLGC